MQNILCTLFKYFIVLYCIYSFKSFYSSPNNFPIETHNPKFFRSPTWSSFLYKYIQHSYKLFEY